MSDAKIEVDPEFAGLIPKLMDEEMQKLEASIRKDGCIDRVRYGITMAS